MSDIKLARLNDRILRAVTMVELVHEIRVHCDLWTTDSRCGCLASLTVTAIDGVVKFGNLCPR